MTKITFIGAGSVEFTKELLGDILTFPELQDCTISLHDIDQIRLDTADKMARWTVEALGAQARIESSLDRQEAIRGADFVINMVQVGMHEATLIDFNIPRKYGLPQTIGDTHGIGGIFRALRTIPVMQGIIQDMKAAAPDAMLLNYTNPMAILVWYAYEYSDVPVIGLCHSVQLTTRTLAKYAGLPYNEVSYYGAGINHLAFILKFRHNGKDAYPLLRRALERGDIPPTDQVRAEMFRRLGYYVTESSEHNAEYSPYFIPHAGLIEKYNIPIDEYIRRSEASLVEFEEIRAKLLKGDPFEIERSAEYASLIIHSMLTGQPRTIYGNVRNNHLIENLPDGCCVEVPCLVDANGVQPTHVGSLPPQLAAIMRPHVSVQELVVRAALEGKRDYVYQAAMLDPLASSILTIDQIWAMVDDLIAAHGDALPAEIRR